RSAIAPTMPHMYPLLLDCPASLRESAVRPDTSGVRPDTGRIGISQSNHALGGWHGDCVQPPYAFLHPDPDMDIQARIRDTSAQDQVLASPTGLRRVPRTWLLAGGAALAVAALVAWVASGWASGSSSYDASRVRIAEVTRGDLVRDLSADGRVITANSPTLYAIAGGTVSLKVVA